MIKKVLEIENRLCTSCMNHHDVKKVLVNDETIFKGINVNYDCVCYYCENTDEMFEDEEMLTDNDTIMKDEYRKKMGLLTSKEIEKIRKKYLVSQKDLCILLGWGEKTITRYESHQVQDSAHDTILKKIDQDPEWFIKLLKSAKNNLPEDSYQKYLKNATSLYESSKDIYLRKAIEASYVKYQDDTGKNGNSKLSLDKVVDVIRYIASSEKVTSLYKVKLMKLMWYSDALAYKRRGYSITGLVYQALKMGAVPIGHDSIINLKGVPCAEIDIGETNAYFFSLKNVNDFPFLSEEEKNIIDVVIDRLGAMSKEEIVKYMHNEEAYIKTPPRNIIEFKYISNLQI